MTGVFGSSVLRRAAPRLEDDGGVASLRGVIDVLPARNARSGSAGSVAVLPNICRTDEPIVRRDSHCHVSRSAQRLRVLRESTDRLKSRPSACWPPSQEIAAGPLERHRSHIPGQLD